MSLREYAPLFEFVNDAARRFIDDLEYETQELASGAADLPHGHPVADFLQYVDDIVGIVCGIQMEARQLLDSAVAEQ